MFGFLSITSFCGGSTANARAGSESVTKFIHNMCIGSNGTIKLISIPNKFPNNGVIKIATNSVITSPTLLDNKNCIAFKMLS